VVILTEREKRRANLVEWVWTVFGAAVLLTLVWEVLYIGGPYVIP
jgi:hypothetical protein